MSPLKEIIIERIKREGPISFEAFMEMALYYPGLGYYTKDLAAIGREGDFYTSPHLHRIFGAMLGRQMEEMWMALGFPETFRIVELGAGMGYLARDMLQYVASLQFGPHSSGFFDSLEYTIVEPGAGFKKEQHELLSQFLSKVTWVSSLSDLVPVTGCFLSNELLDAFPVKMVEKNDTLHEIFVSAREEELVEMKIPCGQEVREYFTELGIELPEGYRTEVNLKVRGWIAKVSEKLKEGFVVTVDYGYPAWDYYSEERNRGTMLCYYRHQVNANPYLNIGEQDITAHVNFSSLKRWGEERGLKAGGFCGQGAYLVSLGIDEVIELYSDISDPFEIAKIKGLILPEGMGESHKVMIQHRGHGKVKLRGFALRNQWGKL